MDQNTVFTLAAAVKNAGDKLNTARGNRDALSALLETAQTEVFDVEQELQIAKAKMQGYILRGALDTGSPDTVAPAPAFSPAMPAPPSTPWGAR